MIKYIQAIAPRYAEGLVKPVYAQIKRDFGKIVEPFLLHSPIPELLAGAWMVCRETELVGSVPRYIKEAAAVAVSQQNQCPYCIDAHTIMLCAENEKELSKAIKNGNYIQIKDTKARAITVWLQNGYGPKPFSETERPEIIGTVTYFHYINRMANVLLSDTPLPTNHRLLRGTMLSVATLMFSGSIHHHKTAGESLQFLAETELPDDLAWAKGTSNVVGAYARFAKTVENAGSVLPFEVRSSVEAQIDNAITAHKKRYLTSVVGSEVTREFSDEACKVACRLALLTALASHRVDNKVVSMFRKHFPKDAQLIGALAWASFTAARKIGVQLSKS